MDILEAISMTMIIVHVLVIMASTTGLINQVRFLIVSYILCKKISMLMLGGLGACLHEKDALRLNLGVFWSAC